MPIFCESRFTCAGGRFASDSPWQYRSIEIAASCPCATSQMMVFGPNAESPPKNTSGDVDSLAAQTPRAAAAIHRCISPAHHDDAFADRRDVAERHRRQPIDADMNVLARLVASGNRDIAPAWRTAADEHGVELLLEQRT